jgi:hypothetical protein
MVLGGQRHSPNDSIGKERKQDITPSIYTQQDEALTEAAQRAGLNFGH